MQNGGRRHVTDCTKILERFAFLFFPYVHKENDTDDMFGLREENDPV